MSILPQILNFYFKFQTKIFNWQIKKVDDGMNSKIEYLLPVYKYLCITELLHNTNKSTLLVNKPSKPRPLAMTVFQENSSLYPASSSSTPNPYHLSNPSHSFSKTNTALRKAPEKSPKGPHASKNYHKLKSISHCRNLINKNIMIKLSGDSDKLRLFSVRFLVFRSGWWKATARCVDAG